MKQKILILLFATLVGTGLTQASVVIDGIAYVINETKNAAAVTSDGTPYTGKVVIPATITYNDKPYSVISIGVEAFNSCSKLTSISIPNSVTTIGQNAFQSCISLSDIALPASLQEIDKAAFSACPELPAVSDFIRRKEAEAKDAEYLRSRRPVWRRQGRCQYCGGFFKGGLKGIKVCSMCGMEKDY